MLFVLRVEGTARLPRGVGLACRMADRAAIAGWLFVVHRRVRLPPTAFGLSRPKAPMTIRLNLMYRCQSCSCVAPPRTPARRIVVETRPKTYPSRAAVNRVVRKPPDGKRKVEYMHDPGGTGNEIVREIVVCPHCFAQRC